MIVDGTLSHFYYFSKVMKTMVLYQNDLKWSWRNSIFFYGGDLVLSYDVPLVSNEMRIIVPLVFVVGIEHLVAFEHNIHSTTMDLRQQKS